MRIGIVAPASAVGQVELSQGAGLLRARGFDVLVHPQCARQHFTFAGTDRERADALYEYANDSMIDVIWAAGGGYGATRLLPLLEELAEATGNPPRKLLVGYSDITALHEFVRSRWNWASLHCPMLSAASFTSIAPAHFDAALAYVRRRRPDDPWGARPLEFIASQPAAPVPGVLVGGNLSLWAALAGTPYAPLPVPGRILFFEDIGEPPYRIDRMATQLFQARAFDGAAAIVLGDFTDCRDEPAQVLASADGVQKLPLRPRIDPAAALAETFAPIADRLGIPLARGLPVGHGPNFAPLPLGAEYALMPDGALVLRRWSWLRGSEPLC